ncbi:MAG: hypothetical protein A2148_00560 [Chloroflexi bacterium RBG_16_68_14]|nr:MAG: hypothetical protein A2148_00560 [Chloroflexi bacterium RBG_16_68_14]
MAPRWIPIAVLVLVAAGSVLSTGRVAAMHPFDNALVRYTVKLADNRPGVASDLRLGLHFSAPSPLPQPFGGIVHRPPAGWGIAADEAVPDGDRVGRLNIVLDNPLILDPVVCPAAPIPALVWKTPLMDASSDSSAPDYPPFLPEGNHKARWTGQIEYGDAIIPVNVLVRQWPDLAPEERLQLFVGTGDGPTGLPMLDQKALDGCFSLHVSLDVAGKSASGVPVAVNPEAAGKYIFVAELASKPDPTDLHTETLVLEASVVIKKAPAGYKVAVRDHNPGVASDLVMALNFWPKSPLPQPFGGITHRAPTEWGIASDEEVTDGDGVARLRLLLNVPPLLANVCPKVLPDRPSLALSVPLRDASSDSEANDYPPFLPPGQHKARWTGGIGLPPYSIPVNVLVDEKSAGGTTMRLFVGWGPHQVHFGPLPKCLSLDVALQVAGHSRSGVPVAVNPVAKGTYSFLAHVVTLPKPNGEPMRFDLKADVTIEASPPPEPCLECPPADEDRDGIPDDVDGCPQEPEDTDSYDASDGCPDSGDDDTDNVLNLLELLLLSDPASQDGDSDGCADGAELGPVASFGGLRDATNPWDFFDFNGDRYIDAPNDILGVMLRYSANPSLPYDARADRGPAIQGAQYAWQRAGPDGRIDAPNDILSVKLQYQHNCRK